MEDVFWTMPATEIAAGVQVGDIDAVAVTTAALARIEAKDETLGAFVARRDDDAVEEASEVAGRGDVADLPLAGVPVAVKDIEDVSGLPTRHGSAATSTNPAAGDGPMTAALREAGAVIIGKTRLPELAIWPFSDDEFGVARNPWDLARSSGGSSGGSASAVAAGLAPLALGSDGVGSVRIPSASCGIFGIKPGRDVLPVLDRGGDVHWFGMSHYGPMATTVSDAALMLDVLAGTDRYRDPMPPQRPLRIAVSAKAGLPLGPVDPPWREAVIATARVLHRAGHRLTAASPPSTFAEVRAVTSRWLGGPSRDVQDLGLDLEALEGRTRTHLRAGELFSRVDPVETEQVSSWRDRVGRFFDRFDVLVTPALSTFPAEAASWRERSWATNFNAALPQAKFTGLWNLADFPAASVPVGLSEEGLPLAVQIVAPDGHEELVLSLAAHLEQLAPWPRHPAGAA